MALTNSPHPSDTLSPTPFGTAVCDDVSQRFGVVAQHLQYGHWCLEVGPTTYYAVMQDLKHTHGFTMLTDLCGVHHAEGEATLAVVAQVHHLPERTRLFVTVRLAVTETEPVPVVDSLVPLFPSANWMERETYDFFGIQFAGHPNLKRILNEDDMAYFPLRKEYPLEDQSRTDKDDRMFGR